jgi:Septum formation
VGLRFNPPPGWPPAPEGFTPQPGWQPDPSWPPPPPGWQLWVNEEQPPQTVNTGQPTPCIVPGQPPRTSPTRGWAIASFVLGLLVVLSVIFAFIAANAGKATRSASTGVITHRGHIVAFSLRVGDCFDNPPGAQTVNTVTAIPCHQAHNAQIYAKFRLAGSDHSYPGAAAVARLARNGCDARIGSVDKAMTTSAMTVRILLPEKTSWAAGQRTVSCMVVNPTATLTTSLLNSTPGAG